LTIDDSYKNRGFLVRLRNKIKNMPFYNILIFSVILFNCIFFQKKAVKYFGREGKSFYLCTRFPDERGGRKEGFKQF